MANNANYIFNTSYKNGENSDTCQVSKTKQLQAQSVQETCDASDV